MEEIINKKQPPQRIKQLSLYVSHDDASPVQRFFNKYFGWLIYKVRFPIIVVGMLVYGFNIYCTLQLSNTNKTEPVLMLENPMEKVLDWHNNKLWHESTITIDVYWGIQPELILNETIDKWKAWEDGSIQLDKSFNMAPEANQMAIVKFCELLVNITETINIYCPINNFYTWARQQGYKVPVPANKFDYLLGKYAVQQMKLKDGDFGFVNGKLAMYHISFAFDDFTIKEINEANQFRERAQQLI